MGHIEESVGYKRHEDAVALPSLPGGEIDAPAVSCRYTSYLALRGSVSESRSDPIL